MFKNSITAVEGTLEQWSLPCDLTERLFSYLS